ncbi:Phytochrome-like protein cph2-Bacteriophytochrome cph2, partial [Moritella viscosa]
MTITLQREQALDYKAHHDELTGLKNRITLSKEVEASINALESTNDKIAVLFLDLNLFKQVNDTFGHDIGDLILQETANRLNNAVRSSDTVFRIGGDEFLIILRDIKDNRDVDCVAEKILSAFAKPAIIEGKPMDITISIGAALSPDDSKSSNEVIKFADIAMYVAKRDQETSYK